MILLTKLCFSQDDFNNEDFKRVGDDAIYIGKDKDFNLTMEEKKRPENRIEDIVLSYNYKLLQTKKPDESSFDITSSFGSNIKFSGFWDEYAILNFTPQMFIQPLDFIDIYASHNISCYVPFGGIKKHFQTIALQSLSVVALDNSLKYLFPDRLWVIDVIAFAAKNFIISFFINSLEKDKGKGNLFFGDKYYYYSMNIRF